jgi:hypothetical protein
VLERIAATLPTAFSHGEQPLQHVGATIDSTSFDALLALLSRHLRTTLISLSLVLIMPLIEEYPIETRVRGGGSGIPGHVLATIASSFPALVRLELRFVPNTNLPTSHVAASTLTHIEMFELAHLQELRHLEELAIGGVPLLDGRSSVVAYPRLHSYQVTLAIAKLRQLRVLALDVTGLNVRIIANLAPLLPELRRLRMCGTHSLQIFLDGTAEQRRWPQLEELTIGTIRTPADADATGRVLAIIAPRLRRLVILSEPDKECEERINNSLLKHQQIQDGTTSGV